MGSTWAWGKAQMAGSGFAICRAVARARRAHLQQFPIGTEVSSKAWGAAKPEAIAISAAKKGFRWKRTRHSHRGKQDPEQKQLKQADLGTLKLAAQEGHIELKYLDESGCCLWSPVSYSYSRVGEQKRLEQTERRGKRISILGLWQPDKSFEYALACGSFNSSSYIKVMDWIADKAFKTLTTTGQLTVVAQDNGSLHTSQLTQQQWQRWQEKGLFLFFLPSYCSEMNRIEEEWHQLKAHEIAGRMFEHEYDLANAVIHGMEARSVKGEYTLERFKFNSG